MKDICQKLTSSRLFELLIVVVILINSTLIGVETYTANVVVAVIQKVILGIFTVEILIRYIAADSNRQFFTSWWNLFDLTLVIIGHIPETLMPNASMAMAMRVLRVFRVLRLLRSCDEIKLIISVLIKSLSALFYNLAFFFIFLYLFAVTGVSLFRLPQPDTLTIPEREKYELLMAKAPHAPTNSPEPYGSLHESMFTLFRVMTGDDWTDVRYNLLTARECGLLKVPRCAITLFHVSWFVISAFLLLNLVVGAVLNNYQIVMEEQRKRRELPDT